MLKNDKEILVNAKDIDSLNDMDFRSSSAPFFAYNEKHMTNDCKDLLVSNSYKNTESGDDNVINGGSISFFGKKMGNVCYYSDYDIRSDKALFDKVSKLKSIFGLCLRYNDVPLVSTCNIVNSPVLVLYASTGSFKNILNRLLDELISDGKGHLDSLKTRQSEFITRKTVAVIKHIRAVTGAGRLLHEIEKNKKSNRPLLDDKVIFSDIDQYCYSFFKDLEATNALELLLTLVAITPKMELRIYGETN